MSEFNLGTARGVIELDYTGKGAADRAAADLDRVKGTGDKVSPTMSKVGTASTAAGIAIAGGFATALFAAGKFEKGLSGIEAVSGASADQMDAVRKKALELGRDTAFSATESASAMEELVKAGISIPDVLNGAADSVVALAAAGGVDLPQAATIAANAMNQFGLSAGQMPGIADKIAGAANASAIDVGEFGMSLSQVGAVANTVGLSFDDTAVAIAALGNAGIKGSDAGTSLKTMLMNLQPQTKKQTELMKELGLITADGSNKFFDAQGKIKPMSAIAGELQNALKGMTDAQKTAALEVMFGSDAIRAAAVIADNGAAGFTKLTGEIDKVKAADVAATRMDNMAGKIEQLKGSAETLAIQVGSVLIPVFTSVIEKITEVVNWFTSLDEGTQKTIVGIIAFIGGALLLVGALIKIVQFVQAAKAAWIALNATFLMSPIGLIIGLIIALVGIIIYLWKTNDTFRNNVIAIWNAIKGAIEAVVNWITGTAVPWLVNAWNSIKTGAQAAWQMIVTGAQWLWNMLVTIFQAIVLAVTLPLRAVLAVIQTVMAAAQAIWSAVWNLFAPIVKGVLDVISAIIEVAFAWIVKIIGMYVDAWKTIISTAWSAIKTVVQTSINIVKTIISNVMNAIKAVWTAIWNSIKGFVLPLWNAIKTGITTTINAIKSVISTVVNAIKSIITTGFNAAKATATTIFNALKAAVTTAINGAKTAVQSAISAIKGFFSGAGSWLVQAGKNIIQGLINGIKAMVGKVGSALSGIASKIRSFLPGSPIKEGPLREAGWNSGEPGKKLMKWLAGGVEDNMSLIERAFGKLPTEVPITLTQPDVALAASAARMAGARREDGANRPVPVGRPPVTVEFKNYNPVREKSSQSAVRGMARLSALGIFDDGEDEYQ